MPRATGGGSLLGPRCGRRAARERRRNTHMAGELIISALEDVTLVSIRESSILDGTALETIAEQLYPLIDDQARRKIILDFSRVRFLSSSMIGVLLSLHGKAQAVKGKVIICGLQPSIRKVFTVSKIDKILEVADTEADALRMF